jgi:hypothetical protein
MCIAEMDDFQRRLALQLNSDTSKTLCASLVGLCKYLEVHTYSLTFPSPSSSDQDLQQMGLEHL